MENKIGESVVELVSITPENASFFVTENGFLMIDTALESKFVKEPGGGPRGGRRHGRGGMSPPPNKDEKDNKEEVKKEPPFFEGGWKRISFRKVRKGLFPKVLGVSIAPVALVGPHVAFVFDWILFIVQIPVRRVGQERFGVVETEEFYCGLDICFFHNVQSVSSLFNVHFLTVHNVETLSGVCHAAAAQVVVFLSFVLALGQGVFDVGSCAE